MNDYPEPPPTAIFMRVRGFANPEHTGDLVTAPVWTANQLKDYVDADRAMRANDAKDAARYRWLRDQHWVEPEATFRLGLVESEFTGAYHDALDAAIDAAMKA